MRITMKQMLAAVAIVASLMAVLARGHQLLGSHGLWLFGFFSVATVILSGFLYGRWASLSWFARLASICVVCLPVIPMAIPKLIIADYDQIAFIADKERSAARLNQLLASDSRFHGVSVSYVIPTNQKGEWLAVNGSVATMRDREDLQQIVDRTDDWFVKWAVAVSESSNVK